MTLEIKVASSLMKYSFYEQTRILEAIEHGNEADLPTAHLKEGAAKVVEVFDNHDPIVEGYAGFPVDRDMIAKKKAAARDDRNVGRVVKTGSGTFLITGRKADGRYQIVSKDGAKSAKAPEDIGLNLQREDVVGIDIEDLHQMMIEKKMDGLDDNNPTQKCWKGYVKRGTKMKGGKEVNNCVKEDSIEEVYKGKHGQSDKEYADSRSQGGKMVSGDSKRSGAEYTHGRRVKAANPGMQPDVGGKTKPKSQGKMDAGTRADLDYRKANLKKKANEEFDVWFEEVLSDPDFDTLSFEELHDLCVEALLELDGEVLTETLEMIDGMDLLTERVDPKETQRRRDQAKDRLATGAAMKRAAEKSSGGSSPSRGERLKGALKTAASAVRKGVVGAAKLAGKAAGHAKNLAKDAGSAAKDGYKSTQSAKPSSGGSSSSSSGSEGGGSSEPAKPSGPAAASGAQKSGDSSKKKGPGLASKLKRGLKKAVGVGSRAVSKASGYVAKRLGEESKYDWRKEIMGEE